MIRLSPKPQPQPTMILKLLSLLLACASAQKDGGGGGTACDMCGASATYTETIPDNGWTRCDVGICKSGSIAKRSIVSNGCPNHYSVCTGKAGVSVSEAYLEAGIDPDFATQSGPMLVIDGDIHPSINADGTSRKRRNGVGVSEDGETVYFAISDGAVTFHEFASLFRDRLDAPNALFLDGQVSRLYAPMIGRNEPGLDMGPIVGVVE